MANPWFRFHADALNNPKVQSLTGDLFKSWVNVLCVASQCDGRVTSHCDMAFYLRMSQSDYEATVLELSAAGLIVTTTEGVVPANWDERQFKATTSAQRTKAYRARQKEKAEKALLENGSACDGHGDVTVTPQNTDTDTDTDKGKDKGAEASAPPAKSTKAKPASSGSGSTRAASKLSPDALAGLVQPPEGVTPDDWHGYLVARRDKRKPPMTEDALRLFVAAFARTQIATGLDPLEIITDAKDGGWQTVKPDYFARKSQGLNPNAAHAKTRPPSNSAVDRVGATVGLDPADPRSYEFG